MTPIRRMPEAEFWFRDVVYLRVASERNAGMIFGITLRETQIVYEVQWEGGCSLHHDFELSTEYVPDFARESDTSA